jgi:hypothetical protein
MGFDALGFIAVRRAGFDHIWVDRSLHQEARLPGAVGLGFKEADKGFANDAAFAFRLAVTPSSLSRNLQLR